jgi:hypothetical protein
LAREDRHTPKSPRQCGWIDDYREYVKLESLTDAGVE